MSTASGAGASRASVHRGHLIDVAGDATIGTARQSLRSIPDGALVVDAAGAIAWLGAWRELPAEYADWRIVEEGAYLIPGFVDAHLHYPQTYSAESYGGGQLLEWLDTCIFPAESRLADRAFAEQIARDFCRRRIAAGTTAAMVFGSAFPHAQDALYRETLRTGLRVVSGRGIQTVGPGSASALITDEETAIRLVREEIDAWHLHDTGDARTARIQVAVVPRFSLSVTPTTFAALGDLYAEERGRGVYFHSHLSENDRPGTGEVAAVREVYGTTHYLDTYDGRFLPGSARGGESLLGRRSILAHSVHCHDDELALMAATGTSIAHCPTSQLFLGSGTMPWRRTVSAGVTVAMGSDIGGGDEWMISRVLGDSYKVHLSEEGTDAVALHPAELLYSGTLAGAQALDMDSRFGNFDLGKDADFLAVDPARQESLALLLDHGIRAEDDETATAQTLFRLLLGMREDSLAGVYVQGRRISSPDTWSTRTG